MDQRVKRKEKIIFQKECAPCIMYCTILNYSVELYSLICSLCSQLDSRFIFINPQTPLAFPRYFRLNMIPQNLLFLLLTKKEGHKALSQGWQEVGLQIPRKSLYRPAYAISLSTIFQIKYDTAESTLSTDNQIRRT